MGSINDSIGHVYSNTKRGSETENVTEPKRFQIGNDKGKKKTRVNQISEGPGSGTIERYHTAYKYSNKGKDILREAVILAGLPVYLEYEYGQISIVKEIHEGNRCIRPPYPEEYPYEAYEFANIEEVRSLVKEAESISKDSLVISAMKLVQEYNDQDYNKIFLIATDILFSYFQDKFATTHYVSIVGDNDSGKTSLGITFEAAGYRPVYMTDPSAANIFRCLGSIESGQCTIILDEADKIDKSPEMMAILKTGYQLNGKVPKINTNTLRQEFFFTYGLKVIISERSMSLTEARGVYDRTFSFTAYTGDPKFDIKETLNPQGNAACQSRLDRLRSFRKLMLIYRLVHFDNQFPDFETGLKRRNRELCKPILQLFYGCKQEIQTEIKSMLEHFLAVKRLRKENTLEAALYPIIINLIAVCGTEVSTSDVWNMIIAGKVSGYYDERKPNEYQTADYGTIYRNSVTNIICDKFGAQRRHKERGNILIFDLEKLVKIGKSYDIETSIQLKLPTEDRAEGSEGSEGFMKKTDVIEQDPNIELTTKENNFHKIFEQTLDIKSNILSARNEERFDKAIKLSEPSEPSVSNSTANSKDPVTSNSIYRLGHSDIFGCRNCKVKGDKFFMEEHTCKISKKRKYQFNLHILDLIKCKYKVETDEDNNLYYVIYPRYAKGSLCVTENSPHFITGFLRMKGNKGEKGGSYPYRYLEVIDYIFGKEENTIEVCSGSVKGRNASSSPDAPYTVDINPDMNPDYVGDAQVLRDIANGTYSRWRGDPPYTRKNAKTMYGTELPKPLRLLEAGARVCKPGSLMLLLLGNSLHYNRNGIMRIGCIAMSVIPNNEVRFLNIYLKCED